MCAKSKKPKLTVELIPKTCWFSSVRTMVPKKDWDTLRFASYEIAGNKCQICSDNGLNQGYKHKVECHEIWEYDDENHIQKLIGLISLCVRCHQVKHIGRAIAMGRTKEAYDHLIKVNRWTLKQVEKHISDSFILHKERSKHQWTLDISILSQEPYNLNLKEFKTRKFEVKKYKKKPKSKKKKLTKKKSSKRPPKKSR